MITYLPRIADKILKIDLELFSVVSIAGPKGCGKTTTVKQFSKSILDAEEVLDDMRHGVVTAQSSNPLLEGESPRLVGEWQSTPSIWEAICRNVDNLGEPGQFILTESAAIDLRTMRQMGTGRVAGFRIHTMSLFESGDSRGTIRLSNLFDRQPIVSDFSDVELDEMIRLVVRGGFPGSLNRTEDGERRYIEDYCESIVCDEMSWPEGNSHDPRRLTALLKSLSGHSTGSAPRSAVMKDIAVDGVMMHRNTFDNYVRDLKATYIIEDLDAWVPKLCSKTAVRRTPIHHMTDPSIAAYFLGMSAADLTYDFETFRFLFESMVVRDIRCYAEALGGKVYHYRDEVGLEVDIILHLNDGRWAAMEVKLGSQTGIDEGVRSLVKLRNKVDESYRNKLSFLAVITATKLAYTRIEGVHVIPITCLRDRRSLHGLPLGEFVDLGQG